MKIIRGLGIFLITATLLGSCFDPPEFPVVPEIEFEKIEFIDDPGTVMDSLVLYISFRDGDGNLGLDPNDLQYISDPFNNAFFFQENNGGLDTLSTVAGASSSSQYDILQIDNPSKGKLVSFATRKKPAYNTLPPYNCYSYEFLADRVDPKKPSAGLKLLIEAEDLAVVGPSTKIVDTLSSPGKTYYQIRDTLLFTRNPNHFNIEVDFFIRDFLHPNADPVTGFYEFDWVKELCQSFDGRFPVLSDNDNSLEGTLSYAMISTGFKVLFGNKTLKLRIQVKDRLLNKSQAVYTGDFTLNDIKKK